MQSQQNENMAQDLILSLEILQKMPEEARKAFIDRLKGAAEIIKYYDLQNTT